MLGQSLPATDTPSGNVAQPRRIPTVFSPFHAGTIFKLSRREVPPGVTLNFQNMTLLLPNVTYDGIFVSGFMEYFELGRSARFCFTNRCAAERRHARAWHYLL